MKKILYSLLVAVVAISMATAQTPPPAPVPNYAASASQREFPGRNLAVLKAFLEPAAKQGILNVNHPGILPGGYAQVSTGIHLDWDAAKVVESLRSMRFSFGLADITGPVGLYVSLSDRVGHPLFLDDISSSFQVQKGGNVWLADDGRSLRPKLVQTPALQFPGLESASAVLYDSSGTNLVFLGPLRVEKGGYILYPTNMVGRTGEYVLDFREPDGRLSTVVFDALSGVVKPTQVASGGVSIDIDGDYNFGPNPSNIGLFGVEDIRSAIVRFEIQALPDGSLPLVGLGGQSKSGESPTWFLFRPESEAANDGAFVFRPLAPRAKPEDLVYMRFSVGKYQLIYVMTQADLDGIPLLPPGYYGDSNGGKGNLSDPSVPSQAAQ